MQLLRDWASGRACRSRLRPKGGLLPWTWKLPAGLLMAHFSHRRLPACGGGHADFQAGDFCQHKEGRAPPIYGATGGCGAFSWPIGGVYIVHNFGLRIGSYWCRTGPVSLCFREFPMFARVVLDAAGASSDSASTAMGGRDWR